MTFDQLTSPHCTVSGAADDAAPGVPGADG